MGTLLYGTKGTIICDNTSDFMTLYEVDESKEGDIKEKIIKIDVNNHNSFYEFGVFADSVINDMPVAMSASQGAKTIAYSCGFCRG